MNCKAKGARNEHKTIRLLETCGYRCTRAAASLGVFDIIAIRKDKILLVQVKSNCWPSREEMRAITGFACPPNAEKVIYRWRDRERVPDIKTIRGNMVWQDGISGILTVQSSKEST